MSLLHAPRFFDEVFDPMTIGTDPFQLTNKFFRDPNKLTAGGGMTAPLVDLSETSKHYLLEADIPGVNKEDIDIEWVDDSVLSLRGHRSKEFSGYTYPATEGNLNVEGGGKKSKSLTTKTQSSVIPAGEDASRRTWARERSYGAFQRTFRFPTQVDQNGVSASYKDGTLRVLVPKAEHITKKIAIEDNPNLNY